MSVFVSDVAFLSSERFIFRVIASDRFSRQSINKNSHRGDVYFQGLSRIRDVLLHSRNTGTCYIYCCITNTEGMVSSICLNIIQIWNGHVGKKKMNHLWKCIGGQFNSAGLCTLGQNCPYSLSCFETTSTFSICFSR